MAALHRLGCDVAQGFYLARPGSADDIDELLRSAVAAGTARPVRRARLAG